MLYKITLGRQQLTFKTSRKPGRPTKPIGGSLVEFFKQLIHLAQNKRLSGHPFSRVFRRVFEAKKVKQFLGINLMAITLFTGVVIPPRSAFSTVNEAEVTQISASIVQMTTEETVRMPVDNYQISQGYHWLHKAVDLAAPLGSPVYPIMEGKVEAIYSSRYGYGNHLIIDHGSGFKSLSAHLAKIVVKENEEVDKNTVIGTIGRSGWSTGPHLHLEVYDHGQAFNPLTILK